MSTTQIEKKKAALIAFNMRGPFVDPCAALMARKHRMNALLGQATQAFWKLDKMSAYQVWFAASSDVTVRPSLSATMTAEIESCFGQL